jgi:hypothetical protein
MRQRVSSFLNASRKRTGRDRNSKSIQVFSGSRGGVFNDASEVPPSSLIVNFLWPKSTPELIYG